MNKRAFAGGALVVGVILLALLFFIIFKMTAEGTSTVKKEYHVKNYSLIFSICLTQFRVRSS